MRQLAGNALRVLLGLFLGLAVAELGARVWLEWLPQPRDGTYLRDPVIGYRLRPQPARGDTAGNPYHVNSLGFRDREHAPTKPAGVRRVLGIGDSFVAGEVPLADNFLRAAERHWNADRQALPAKPAPDGTSTRPRKEPARHGVSAASEGSAGGMVRPASPTDSVEVFLMGLGGYGPEQYVGTLRSVGLATAPDLVLLCFYIGNDVTGIPTRHEVRRGELYSTSSSDPRLNILRRSHLFAWMEKRLFFRLRRRQAEERRTADATATPASPPPTPGSTAPLTRLYLQVLYNRLPFYAASPPARVELLWTGAETFLDTFGRSCRNASVPWALVIIPDEFQVDPAVRKEALRRLGARGEELDIDGPPRRLMRWAADHGVPALDLLPIFREETARKGSLYIPSNTHWNEAGNLLAGDAVARFADSLPEWRPRPAGNPAAVPADRKGETKP